MYTNVCPIVFNFQAQLKRNLRTVLTPGDLFLKFFGGTVLDGIIYQSNLYANQKQVKMQPITQQEMYGFLGINIFMGYHKLPSWSDYWRIDPDLIVPFVPSTLSRNRFSQILGNLHIYDNHAIPEGSKDKLLKLRPLITAMNNNYKFQER